LKHQSQKFGIKKDEFLLMFHQANKITIKSPDESGAKIIRFWRPMQRILIFLAFISDLIESQSGLMR